jgi:hypothetical protein
MYAYDSVHRTVQPGTRYSAVASCRSDTPAGLQTNYAANWITTQTEILIFNLVFLIGWSMRR